MKNDARYWMLEAAEADLQACLFANVSEQVDAGRSKRLVGLLILLFEELSEEKLFTQ